MVLATELSGRPPGKLGFLGALQDATTVMLNALSLEDLKNYAQAVKEWFQKSSPPQIQSGCVVLYSPLAFLTQIQDSSIHAQADHPGLPETTVQDLGNLQSCTNSQHMRVKIMILILLCECELCTFIFWSNLYNDVKYPGMMWWCRKGLEGWKELSEILPRLKGCQPLGGVETIWDPMFFWAPRFCNFSQWL